MIAIFFQFWYKIFFILSSVIFGSALMTGGPMALVGAKVLFWPIVVLSGILAFSCTSHTLEKIDDELARKLRE